MLIARTSAPPGAPLSAVTADLSGSLGGCACIDGEYGLPAVAGTIATSISLGDGQVVEVNGDNRLVSVVHR